MASPLIHARISPDSAAIETEVDLSISATVDAAIHEGAECWVFMDIRQDAGRWQRESLGGPNRVRATLTRPGVESVECDVTCGSVRTLDLYPVVPEFLSYCMIELQPCDEPGSTLEISVDRWMSPERPIDEFHFWMLSDLDASMQFEPTGYKTYRSFYVRGGSNRIMFSRLSDLLQSVSFRATGAYRSIPEVNTRYVPGIAWGELHGMAFNQRPIDDFYRYAKEISKLDFCAAALFSYNTCVGDVWEQVIDARNRYLVNGEFVPVLAFECGTPIDDSHRLAYFVSEVDVPPIFCDSRPPALDPFLQRRFHPDTVRCNTVEDYYETVNRYGGFVGGHFHTLSYRREILAELWQKQEFTARYQQGKPSLDEEENIYEYLRRGMRMAFTGGSDTHDSMPGNPYPEPGCPRPAGFTGVHLDELTPDALETALRARRTIATTGARIGIWLNYDVAFIGDIARYRVQEPFVIRVDAPGYIDTVELLENGVPVATWEGNGQEFEATYVPEVRKDEEAFYHVRVRQRGGHRGWSSPIWLQFP